MITAFLVLTAFLTSVISGFAGIAGGIILLVAMMAVLPAPVVIPLHGIVQLASNATRVVTLRHDLRPAENRYFLIGAVPGAIAGYLLLSRAGALEWMDWIIIGLIIYVVFRPQRLPEIRLSPRAYLGVGTLTSAVGCLIGATGPLQAPFFVRSDWRKEEIVANQAMAQAVVHAIKIPVFLGLAFSYLDHALTLALMVGAAILGNRGGTFMLRRVNRKTFTIVIKTLLLLVAGKMAYDRVFS